MKTSQSKWLRDEFDDDDDLPISSIVPKPSGASTLKKKKQGKHSSFQTPTEPSPDSPSSIIDLIGTITTRKKEKTKMAKQPTAEHQLADPPPSSQIVESHSSPSSSPQSTTSKSRKQKGKWKAATSKPPPQELQLDKNSTNPSLSVTPSSLSLKFFKNFFRGHNFEARYKTSIVQKPFVYEKIIDMYLYQNSPLHKLFNSYGIASMVVPPSVTYPKSIQQFYINLEHIQMIFTLLLLKANLLFTVKDLGTILSIISTGICPFTIKGVAYEPFEPFRAASNCKR